MIKGWMREAGETEESHPWKVGQSDLDAQKDKVGWLHVKLQPHTKGRMATCKVTAPH